MHGGEVTFEPPSRATHLVAAFGHGLKEAGFVEARTSRSNTAPQMII
jgi:hypothetical protein